MMCLLTEDYDVEKCVKLLISFHHEKQKSSRRLSRTKQN
jgi:hypothetical protein